jgi:DNA-binding winged helix-turn-helix (wHTH) protein
MAHRFGEWTLDPDTRELLRRNRAVRISPKAFDLLLYLLGRRPSACRKQELYDHLWPDSFVSEATLAGLVAEVRTALRDDARKPRFVRTVHNFGYAFSGEVADEPAESTRQEQELCVRLIWRNREIELRQGENILGRTRDAVVWIEGSTVSRRHARLRVEGGTASLEDLGSKNGTFVGDARIEAITPLADGDSFRLGDEWMTFRAYTGQPTRTGGG